MPKIGETFKIEEKILEGDEYKVFQEDRRIVKYVKRFNEWIVQEIYDYLGAEGKYFILKRIS